MANFSLAKQRIPQDDAAFEGQVPEQVECPLVFVGLLLDAVWLNTDPVW